MTHEKTSSTTFSTDTLLLMSAKALSQRDWIPSLVRCVSLIPETFDRGLSHQAC